MTSFLQGLAIGFLLAAPIGPAGILCIRQTLSFGNRSGMFIGLSAASADIVYAIVAAFGVAAISEFVAVEQRWLRLASGIFLLAVGFYTFRSGPGSTEPRKGPLAHAGLFASTFAITITNPLTLFAYAAVFSGFGVAKPADGYWPVLLLIAGVYGGSLLWFSSLVMFARFLSKKGTDRGLAMANKIAGALLMVFGAIAVVGAVMSGD